MAKKTNASIVALMTAWGAMVWEQIQEITAVVAGVPGWELWMDWEDFRPVLEGPGCRIQLRKRLAPGTVNSWLEMATRSLLSADPPDDELAESMEDLAFALSEYRRTHEKRTFD